MSSQKATLRDGKIIIDWQWLASEMDDDCMREMMACAAFNDHFIKAALEVVVNGQTEDGSWFGARELHEMRRQLLPLLPILAKETIEGAQAQLDTAEKWREKTVSEMWSKEREADNRISELRQEIERQKNLILRLQRAIAPFVVAYRKEACPVSDSDLDNEQPRHVTVLLGDCRYASQQYPREIEEAQAKAA